MLTPEQVGERRTLLLAQERDNPPVLWWLSFCDPGRPKGQQFLGVAVVEASGLMHAHQRTWALGINPGGEIQACPVGGVPIEYRDRLLSRTDLEAAGLV